MIKPKIYLSNKCKYCKDLLIKIKEMNMNVDLINIDRESYPSIIKSVPTLIADEFNNPLVGKKVFEWVDNYKYFYQKSNNIMLSKNIVLPKNSDLLKEQKEPNNKQVLYCNINDSINLLI
jgi:hypothetical protein